MVVNIPICIDADDMGDAVAKNIQQEVGKKIKEKLNKAILRDYPPRKYVYTSSGYYSEEMIDSAWSHMAQEIIDSMLGEVVRQFVKDNKEEIIDKICAESANRILRSSKNRNVIVEKLLELLSQ